MVRWRQAAAVFFWVMMTTTAYAQPEVNGWGEMRGVRIDGELFPVSTSIAIAGPNWNGFAQTAHWRTRDPKWFRDAADSTAQVTTGELVLPGHGQGAGVAFKQIVKPAANGDVSIDVEVTSTKAVELEGVYFFVAVPESPYGAGSGELTGTTQTNTPRKALFAATRPADDRHYAGGVAQGVRFHGHRSSVEVKLPESLEIVLQDDRAAGEKRLSAFFPLHTGSLAAGQTVKRSFILSVRGTVDRSPVTVRIDSAKRGAAFDGVGGNFCWVTKSPTVPFYLDNLRLVWGRVSMPLHHWHPREDVDPAAAVEADVHPEVRESMAMAAELHRRGIPVIISVWNAPEWAYQPTSTDRPRMGRRISPEKWDALKRSIGGYLLEYKKVVGEEPALFSFNEPNIGINVLQSPQEHADGIKLLGAHFESLGLKTRLLLGDANEPRDFKFIDPALADPEAMRYVRAISYHSWNYGTEEELLAWGERAGRAGLPLIVGEGGTDPDAHKYREIMDEPWYALDEAAMYVRCLSFSQPQSLLHWQLTPDYGLVKYIEGTPADQIIKTMRWYTYWQIESGSRRNASVLWSRADRPEVTVAALASPGSALSVFYVVNTGPARPLVVKGLPVPCRVYPRVTDRNDPARDLRPIVAHDGTATLELPAECFVGFAVTADRP